ncbi:aspartate dehydrogenase [Rhodoplanes roseus]|uniref:L-aspartate dehydrogenase n=1 Tax=Rhodoplanes roseus TaxID=29409 RepID=A0A327KYA7_9BRAD|nr:aspartate dehydrogenase [Rhodoplanes roseus]RAI43829.1 aspartate dehydrogenase [Rhodoplanes roseus]
MRLGLIGYGAIARTLLGTLAAQHGGAPAELVVLCRPGARARAEAVLSDHPALQWRVVETCDALLAESPDLVVEAAGHEAVRQHGAAVLAAGTDLVIASIGALADATLHADLRAAAERSGARLHLPAGAVGGIDILAAARLGGIDAVTYTSRKPPAAWAGTPAEGLVDLATLDREAILFEGDARAAARTYPKNANVAATIALAGIGFERTRVRLVADPAVAGNVHELTLRAACADVDLRVAGRPSPDNPKTSLSTGYSIARAVLNRIAAEVI